MNAPTQRERLRARLRQIDRELEAMVKRFPDIFTTDEPREHVETLYNRLTAEACKLEDELSNG